MFKIEGNNMYITKGDALDLTVNITDSTGTPIVFKSGDTVALTVKDTYGGTQELYASADLSGVDAVIHTHEVNLPVGQYCAEITYEFKHEGVLSDTYTIFPTWSTKGDTRVMKGDTSAWKNFWVVPKM